MKLVFHDADTDTDTDTDILVRIVARMSVSAPWNASLTTQTHQSSATAACGHTSPRVNWLMMYWPTRRMVLYVACTVVNMTSHVE